MYRYDTTLITCFQRLNRLLMGPLLLLLAFGLSAAEVTAQSSATTPNIYVPLTESTYGNLSVTTDCTGPLGVCGDFSSINSLTDTNLTNAATGPALGIGGTSWIQVNDNDATSDPHPAGSYVGFVAGSDLIGLGSGASVAIYRNGSQVQSVSVSNLLSVNLGGNAKIGFIADEEFDAVRFTINMGVLSIGSVPVYYAEILTPDDAEAPDLSDSCNLEIPWVQSDGTNPGFPVVIDLERTEATGISLGAITGLENVVDSNTDNAASLVNAVGAASTVELSVRSLDGTLPGGTFAGFSVSIDELLSLNALGDGITINTYLGESELPTNTASGDNLTASVGLLGSSDRYTVGFQTENEFDTIQIVLEGGLLNLGLAVFNVYHPVVTNFCEGAALECRTDTPISAPDYPVFINAENTGATGLAETCLLGDCISDMENLINGDPDDGAVITPLATSGDASISVKFGAGTYGGSSSNPVFVGFDIENESLLDVDVLDGIEITTYLNGTEVQTSGGSGGPLVEVGADVLLGSEDSRRTVGFAATDEFDEVQLSITNVLGVNLSATTVYQLILRDLCPGDPLSCGETAILEKDSYPVIVNAERTGFDGAVCVDCSISNVDGVISADEGEYATIEATVDLLSPASISVLNPTETYPAGTYAGFIIDTQSSNLVELDLLQQLQINTYNNGVLQETSSGSDLLTLTVLFITIGSGDGIFQVGFETTQPYDEIQLQVGSLVDANILSEEIHVYNAFVDFSTVDSEGNDCPDITITLTGGSCFRTLSSPVAGLTYAEMLEPVWTQGIPGSDWADADANVWTWPLDVAGNTDSWVPLANMTDVIPAGTGFLMSVFDLDDYEDEASDVWPKTITIPAGPQNAFVLSANMMNENPDGWTLAGNPLQSNIDLSSLTTSGLTGAYYVYDRNLSGETDGNPGGWRSTASGFGDITDGAIAVGQGFFVQNDGTTADRSILFTNAATSDGEFYGKENDERKDFVRFELNGESSFSSAWVRFSDEGSDEHTYGDALKLAPLTANHAILSSQKEDGTMLDIGHFPMPLTDVEIAIPLHVEATESGEYTLTATDFDLPSSMSLYLKDTETGSIVEIREGFEYTFTLSAAKQATPDQGLGSSCSTEPQKVAPVSQTRFLLVNEASVENSELPLEISLEQNYPNPFNPTTVINYHLPASMDVTLQVFDMTGRRVAILQQGTMPAGSHTVNSDATNLSSGVYMYSLQAGQQVYTRKLTLIK